MENTDQHKSWYQFWIDDNSSADDSTVSALEETWQKIECREKREPRFRIIPSLKIVASIAIPLLFIASVYLFVKSLKASPSPELVEYFVPNGEIRELTLPDGTMVLANSGSLLIYPEQFNGKTRSVYLNGEANFSVKEDHTKPFIVKTSSFDVEALGTVFDVSSYQQSDKSSSSLESGKIRVKFKSPEGEIPQLLTLEPGEQIVYDKISGQIIQKKINADYGTAWRQGYLVFSGATIGEIASALERKYNVTVYFNSNKYQHEKITVKFIHGENLDESLQILKKIITGFDFKIESQKVYFN